MKKRMRIVACALIVGITLCLTGCGMGEEPLISGGYVPNEITNIEGGGEFETSSLTPHHDSEGLSLQKLEGFWMYEGIEDANDLRALSDSESFVVADKVVTLNETRIECLPKSFDIRPFSPMKSLIAQGFGYGSAVFQEVADDSNDFGIVGIQMSPSMPYGGNGFICTTNGNTLALGFLGVDTDVDEYGAITDKERNTIDECVLTEIDYEISLEGDRLTLSYDGVSATYVQNPTSTLSLIHYNSLSWTGEPLYEGDELIKIMERTPKTLLGEGFKLDCDVDKLLPSCSVSETFAIKTPGGSTLSAKVVNPYEKAVPVGYADVCWYEYEEGSAGGLTIGRRSAIEQSPHLTQEFGVTPYSDIYIHYELPYELSDDYLCYKNGFYIGPIRMITAWGEGYDTGDKILETEHSCEIRLGFDDNVLTSISVGDPAYLNAGLQDNIARDDLDNLTPSVYREVTERRDEILGELRKAFKGAGLDAAVNEKTGEVVMDNGVLFASDSYELGDKGKDYLDKVFAAYASVILDDKYSASLKEISFEGNTDSDGDSEYNMRLSDNRAKAVMGYCSGLLDESQKAAFDGFAVYRGYGESDLVYDENGEEDKGASRRVAIKFMLNVDDLKSEAGSQKGGGSSSSASASSSSSASSGSASGSAASNDGSDELAAFRGISSKFDRAWTLYEESEDGGTVHAAALLLSEDHGYCGYFDLEQGDSGTGGRYTFGRASVEDAGQNMQAVTVKHGGDADRLDVVFDAWGRDGAVSLKDPWGGVNDLAAFDDVEAAVSLFEDILA